MGRRLYGSGQDRPADASPGARLERAGAWLAGIAAAALLAFVIAHWFWRVVAPAPVPVPPPALPDGSAGLLAAAPLFGGAASVAATDRGAPLAATSAPGDLRLLGVIAGRDGSGQALIRLADRGPLLVAAGQDVSPGVRLDAVYPDRVRISGRGETREILLRHPLPLATPVTAAAMPAASVDRGACAPPAGFKGPVYRVNAELLTGMAAQPESWKQVLGESSGGLVVRDGGGFAAMLGLKPGDRLRDANGIALTANNDLLVAVVKPLQANQAVRVRGAREGAELELLLVNASACVAR
jgi:general secretion pathway protein C